jgi:hypothetical protein
MSSEQRAQPLARWLSSRCSRSTQSSLGGHASNTRRTRGMTPRVVEREIAGATVKRAALAALELMGRAAQSADCLTGLLDAHLALVGIRTVLRCAEAKPPIEIRLADA